MTYMLMLYNGFMKKKITSYITTFLMVFSVIGLPATIYAETSSSSSSTNTGANSTEQESRLEKYKTKLAEVLTEAAKTRIAARCVAAQVLVGAHLKTAKSASTARTNTYNDILRELAAVSSAASNKGVDVTTLNTDTTSLKTKITTYTSDNNTYQTALDDLAGLDCKTDPTAFKAALETARADQIAVLGDAKDIRTFLAQTIKTDLANIKAALKSVSSSTESGN